MVMAFSSDFIKQVCDIYVAEMYQQIIFLPPNPAESDRLECLTCQVLPCEPTTAKALNNGQPRDAERYKSDSSSLS